MVIVAGVLVALWCVFVGRPELRKQNFFLTASVLITAIALSLLYVPPNEQWGIVRLELGYYGRSGEGQFAGDRNLLWARAIELFKDHPWIGHGEGQFGRLADVRWHANHPHNTLLQMLVAWGIIGTAAALYLFGYAIAPVWRQLARVPELAVAPCAVVAGLSAVSLLDGPFFYAYPAMIFVIAAVLIRAAASEVTA